METETFENVKNQIGFCGIWCGSCIVGNGALRELTKRYKETIERYGLEEWGPKDFDFKECMKGLESIKAIPSCEGCLKGDGKENCEIRLCASNMNVGDCSECDLYYQPAACKNVEALQKMRAGALSAKLLVKTDNIDRQELIERWTAELKSKWPSWVLFLDD